MLTGKHFQLSSSMLGIYTVNEQRTAIMIPEGATVLVVPGPVGADRMVDILWDSRTIAVFAIDLMKRSDEVTTVKDDRAASA